MQEDGSKENIDAMINQVIESKLILPANVTPTTQAKTQNGKNYNGTGNTGAVSFA